ncbi:pyridoxal-phosphate dependent enzyme [Pseudomonas sp. 18175]|uniref:pyridoxal-phosphate dependent enzyme n=1 Tax=Pseudomonas sp. 18175 TaxID=3390056 RepID=UPI003D1992E1
MLAVRPEDLVLDDVFLKTQLADHPHDIYLKIEGLSITHSIKLKPARAMVDQFEREGRLSPGSALIESSSGNLGLALSMICASRGYRFICVSDPNISPQTARLIEAYGARLIIVQERDENGGFVGTRMALIRMMLEEDPALVWVNQYENPCNPEAHYEHTAMHIEQSFPRIDYLFVGTGTTGTLGGLSKFFKERHPKTQLVGVDSVGSVTFGTSPGPRFIPGLGASSPPPISRDVIYDQFLMIEERETVRMCRQLLRRGLLLGGSSGTVLCGVQKLLPQIDPRAVWGAKAVAANRSPCGDCRDFAGHG